VLAQLHTLAADWESQVDQALEGVLAQHPEWANLKQEARHLLLICLKQAEIRALFMPREGQCVKTEWEVVDANGTLRRIDCLLLRADEVVVVDFKTGAPDPTHTLQIQEYARLVAALWPERQVRSCLIYLHQTPTVVWSA
jgi:ATP-dependent exoDNAse (exonuclease V) beta subunit